MKIIFIFILCPDQGEMLLSDHGDHLLSVNASGLYDHTHTTTPPCNGTECWIHLCGANFWQHFDLGAEAYRYLPRLLNFKEIFVFLSCFRTG